MPSINNAADQLETELESFRATLDKDLKRIFRSTTLVQFKRFLEPQRITGKLDAISNIIEQLCKLSESVDVLDQELLQSLFGTVLCTLMVGHNRHKDMKSVVEFLNVVGGVVLPGSSKQVDGDDTEQIWITLTVICCELVRWCNVFVTEGLANVPSRKLATD